MECEKHLDFYRMYQHCPVCEITRLKKNLFMAKEALEFYAKDTWDIGCGCCGGANEVEGDLGRRANEALEKIK